VQCLTVNQTVHVVTAVFKSSIKFYVMQQESPVDKFCKAAKMKTNISTLYVPLLLLWSEEHVAGLYCELYETIPIPPPDFLKTHFTIIFHLPMYYPHGSSLPVSRPTNCIYFYCFLRVTFPAKSTDFYLIIEVFDTV
jgi:hypothetical protein